jgi:phospholipid transport system substrate-binding protein
MTCFYKQTRRILLLCVFVAPVLAWAGEPTDQIRQTTDTILAIVKNPALKGPDQEAERQKQLRQSIDKRFDWTAMSRSAVGKYWRDLSAAQRTEFTGLFSDLIEKSYMARIESYSDEKMLYKGDKVDGEYAAVDVVIVTLSGTDVPITYRVLKKGSEWLVYDLSIEGVSLVNNYRSQIGAILNHSPYDVLIAKIKTKIAASPAKKRDDNVRAPAAAKTEESPL